MDFSQDELVEVVDRLAAGLLERAGVTGPPVDAIAIAEEHLGIPVEVVEPAEEDERGRRRPRPRPAGSGIVLSADMTAEQRNKAAADGIARTLLPDVLRKLGVPPGSENKQFAAHVRGLVAGRVLVPTKLLRAALRECRYDLPALKERFATATTEAVALRLLDLDEPCVISIVDDGIVATRRGNRSPAGKKLEPPEQVCHDRVAELELPHRVRAGGWTVQGWPVPGRAFRRIILRAVPDDV
jgi:predicted transcriptional regulator